MRLFDTVLAATMAVSIPFAAAAQTWPERTISMLGPSAGGGADFLMRLVAQGMSEDLGQTVVVENRSGSVGISEFIANGKPDGYTLLFFSSSAWLQPLLGDMDYQPEDVFAPVSMVLSSPGVLAVNPRVGVRTTEELIAKAKAEPGTLNFAGGGFGSANHLSGELFKSLAEIDIAYIPYRGAAEALTAAVAGEVDILFSSVTTVTPFAESGDLIPLGVTVAEPTELAPALPVLADAVPGYASSVDFIVMAPAGTPQPIIDRLNAAILTFLEKPEARAAILKAGSQPVGSSPSELGELMKADIERMSKVIEDANLRQK